MRLREEKWHVSIHTTENKGQSQDLPLDTSHLTVHVTQRSLASDELISLLPTLAFLMVQTPTC